MSKIRSVRAWFAAWRARRRPPWYVPTAREIARMRKRQRQDRTQSPPKALMVAGKTVDVTGTTFIEGEVVTFPGGLDEAPSPLPPYAGRHTMAHVTAHGNPDSPRWTARELTRRLRRERVLRKVGQELAPRHGRRRAPSTLATTFHTARTPRESVAARDTTRPSGALHPRRREVSRGQIYISVEAARADTIEFDREWDELLHLSGAREILRHRPQRRWRQSKWPVAVVA